MLDSTEATPEAPGTELALVARPLVPAVVFSSGGIDAILSEVQQVARKQADELDIDTAKGRTAIKSLAYTVSRTKVGLVGLGKELIEDRTKLIVAERDGITADCKKVTETLDALRDEIRKPVDDWEAEDDARIADHESALRQIDDCAVFVTAPASLEEIEARMAQLDVVYARKWQEFAKRADRAKTAAAAAIANRMEQFVADLRAAEEAKRIADELAAQAEAARVAREAEIATQAAEEARLEAERVAQRRAHARELIAHIVACGLGFIGGEPQPYGILQRELETKIDFNEETFGDLLDEAIRAKEQATLRLEAGIAAQRKRAAEAEAEEAARVAAINAAVADLAAANEREAAAERERERIEQQAADNEAAAARERTRLENEAAEATRRADAAEAQRAADAAAAAEATKHAVSVASKEAAATARANAAAAARKVSADAAVREKDREHRVKIHGQILAGLALANLTETQGMAVIEAIAAGQVPHVRIEY